ncbi:MAG TPA: helix-hairpin-helix domain-containing protein [Myxococcales bacterium]|nr:helix-hairpin-helix domain-containing protein [Myxococcales bacterium]HIK85045.1 helix-hairpin-helix domain-containing protein [Myxococcales bacterium]
MSFSIATERGELPGTLPSGSRDGSQDRAMIPAKTGNPGSLTPPSPWQRPKRSGWSIRSLGSMPALLLLSLLLVSGSAQAESATANAPVDLNRATAEQLEALPGIGAVKAAAILAVRDTKGGFQSMDELEAVRGIGPALVKKLRPLVRIGKKGTSSAKTTRK